MEESNEYDRALSDKKICGCELFVKIQTSINRVKPET